MSVHSERIKPLDDKGIGLVGLRYLIHVARDITSENTAETIESKAL